MNVNLCGYALIALILYILVAFNFAKYVTIDFKLNTISFLQYFHFYQS